MAQRFDEEGIQVTWDLFHDAFLENYFPEDCRGKKEVELLELKQRNGNVAEYAARFQELIKPDIKAIGYQQITRFEELVNKSRIYDEDCRESALHYKALNEKKGKYHGKPYDDKMKKVGHDGKPSGGGSSASVKCYNCGVEGHRVVDCPKEKVTCLKCEQDHISAKCDKPKKEQANGNVFALSSVDATIDDRLIQVCIPLEQLDVILGMNWLEFNRVHNNCFNRTVIFLEIGVKEDLFLSAKQVDESVQDGAELFMFWQP
ncbi:uncharacterized protein LOC131648839 [Vicia villosa]|uniref:uncharacterized protein LOC131648839 n=1 Tax=Vicia villosa TaxID=3911 RepID=UPI00273C3336|nr:uncharacterized protein LOC131648839 [Vicia villosa]